ncbi:MAG: hypothetical protein AAF639_45045, partial [Chloroflexota bacterium]
YMNVYLQGNHLHSDFQYTYDFWAEPAINQGHTGTCVYHSHIGGASKLLNNSLTGFSIANTIAYLHAWKEHHSSKYFANKLMKEAVLVPYPNYNTYPSFLTEYCYKNLEKIKGKSLSPEAESVYNEHKIDLKNDISIDYNEYGPNDDVVGILKSIIDNKGVAMVSIDYPSTDPDLVDKCFGNIWFKHEITSGNYWYCNSNIEQELKSWFKQADDGWHSVIFCGYTKDDNDKGAFAFKNSWGSASGENGNYYMSFEFMDLLTKYRSGGISVTSMIPKINHGADNDFIQYLNPTGKTIMISVDGFRNYWWNNFSGNPVPIGAGLWSQYGNFGVPGNEKIYTVREYSEPYPTKGDLIYESTVAVSTDDIKITIQADKNKFKVKTRNFING